MAGAVYCAKRAMLGGTLAVSSGASRDRLFGSAFAVVGHSVTPSRHEGLSFAALANNRQARLRGSAMGHRCENFLSRQVGA